MMESLLWTLLFLVVQLCPKTKNGARYRVRTCDPYRVKVMLYH